MLDPTRYPESLLNVDILVGTPEISEYDPVVATFDSVALDHDAPFHFKKSLVDFPEADTFERLSSVWLCVELDASVIPYPERVVGLLVIFENDMDATCEDADVINPFSLTTITGMVDDDPYVAADTPVDARVVVMEVLPDPLTSPDKLIL